jgi:diguanylate cyclase (GGDEF)-like protein
MKAAARWDGPLRTALAWAALSSLALFLSRQLNGIPMIWPSSAIALTSLILQERRQWLPTLASIGCAAVAVHWLVGGTELVPAIGYAAAHVVEPLVAVTLLKRLRQRRMQFRMIHVAGFALAALGGAFAGALVALPFHHVPNASAFLVWFLTVFLGSMTLTPLILQAFGGSHSIAPRVDLPPGIGWATLVVFITSLTALSNPFYPLLFIPMGASVYAVSRYGYIGASFCALQVALAGTLLSIGGHSPLVFYPGAPRSAAVFLQFFITVQLATSLPLAAMLISGQRLSQQLERRNRRLAQNLRLVKMAERLGNIGHWQYFPATDRQVWSHELYGIFGLPLRRDPDLGQIRSMIDDGGRALSQHIDLNRHHPGEFTCEFTIRRPDGQQRFLAMRAANEFDVSGARASVFSVVMDITEQRLREDALDRARGRALRLAAEAKQLAETDALTGLANRRRTLQQLRECVRIARDENQPLGAIVFDLDHFKSINDRFGHQTGDEVLMAVAAISRTQIRATDLIGRTGGEEFVWLLPGATPLEAQLAAERLRQAIEKGTPNSTLPGVTASLGYAQYREGDTPEQLLARADAALYNAKAGGRNKVYHAA